MNDLILNYLIEKNFNVDKINIQYNEDTDENFDFKVLENFKDHDFEKVIMVPVFTDEAGYVFEKVEFIADTWDFGWDSVTFFESMVNDENHLYIGYIDAYTETVKIFEVKRLNYDGYKYLNDNGFFISNEMMLDGKELDYIDINSKYPFD